LANGDTWRDSVACPRKEQRNERNVVNLIFEAYPKELKYLYKSATKHQSKGREEDELNKNIFLISRMDRNDSVLFLSLSVLPRNVVPF
jgi:hypothetical protein